MVVEKNDGCFSGCGTAIGVLFLVAVAVKYWYIALGVFVLSEAAFAPLMMLNLIFWVLACSTRQSLMRMCGWSLAAGTSAGLATFPEHADSPEELIAAADAALYHAKANGRNRIEVAVPTLVGG